METEIQKVKDLFNSGELCSNEFTNAEHLGSDYPLIWKEMDELLDFGFVAAPHGYKSSRLGVGITPGYIDFQQHNVSIGEHTDDVDKKFHFQLTVVLLDECGGSKFYDRYPLISYYGGDGIKHTTRLDLNTSIVFNPRKPHSVVYYGYKYTVAVRAVIKSVV